MAPTAYPPGVLESVLGALELGVVVLDHQRRVALWNGWMARHSGHAAGAVLGRDFFSLFPELTARRLDSAVGHALSDNFPSVLSQTLHKAPLPLFADPAARLAGARIDQAVTVTPLAVAACARHCLIQVTDVSAAASRERLLREQALELRSQTYSDGLTGIANRRHFDVELETQARRAKRSGTALSLLMIDIDFFKAYNDNYGHQRGDDALVKVAAALAGMLQRPLDLIARYGGEEFAVILPEMDAAQAGQMAEAMRLAISALDIVHACAPRKRVTVSIGAATRSPSHAGEPHALVGAADRALYAAKHAGRDCVAAASPDQAGPG